MIIVKMEAKRSLRCPRRNICGKLLKELLEKLSVLICQSSLQQLSTSDVSWASQPLCSYSVLVLMVKQVIQVHNERRQMMSVVEQQPPLVSHKDRAASAAYPHKNPESLVHTKLHSNTTAVRQLTWSSQAWVVDCAASGSSVMACGSCATAELEMVAWKGATGHKEKSEVSEHTKSTWSTAQLGSECQHAALS